MAIKDFNLHRSSVQKELNDLVCYESNQFYSHMKGRLLIYPVDEKYMCYDAMCPPITQTIFELLKGYVLSNNVTVQIQKGFYTSHH